MLQHILTWIVFQHTYSPAPEQKHIIHVNHIPTLQFQVLNLNQNVTKFKAQKDVRKKPLVVFITTIKILHHFYAP